MVAVASPTPSQLLAVWQGHGWVGQHLTMVSPCRGLNLQGAQPEAFFWVLWSLSLE